MNMIRMVPFAALLLAGACGSPAPTNQDVNLVNGAANDVVLNEDDAGISEGGAAAPEVAALPAVPGDLSADDAAPLAQATQISTTIADDSAVERIPFEGGWAWRRNGQILRTASRDGHRVSYFRAGEAAPFFVQQGDDSFAYAAGQPQRSYDRSGRPGAVAPARRDEARRLADESRHDHDQAATVPHQGDQPHRPDRPGPNQGAGTPDGGHPGPAGPPAGDHGGHDAAAGNDHGGNGRGGPDRRRPDAQDHDAQGNHLRPQGN
jgi:hypothetical protein